MNMQVTCDRKGRSTSTELLNSSSTQSLPLDIPQKNVLATFTEINTMKEWTLRQMHLEGHNSEC